MATRTTIVLDDESRRAVEELARHYACSMSEAIRRAVVGHRDVVRGVPVARREERVRALLELAELFEGHDAEAELAELNRADEHA